MNKFIIIAIVLSVVFCHANSLEKIKHHRQHTGLREATLANLKAGTATFTIANFATLTTAQKLAAWLGTDGGIIRITAINTAVANVVQADTVSVKIVTKDTDYDITVMDNCATGSISPCDDTYFAASSLNLKGKGDGCALTGTTALQVWYNTLKVFGVISDTLTDLSSIARVNPQVKLISAFLIKLGQSYYAKEGYVPFLDVQPAEAAVALLADADCAHGAITTWGDGLACVGDNTPCGQQNMRPYFNAQYAIAFAGSATDATEQQKTDATAAAKECNGLYSAVLGVASNLLVPVKWHTLRTAIGGNVGHKKKRDCMKKWISVSGTMIKILNNDATGIAACGITSTDRYAYKT